MSDICILPEVCVGFSTSVSVSAFFFTHVSGNIYIKKLPDNLETLPEDHRITGLQDYRVTGLHEIAAFCVLHGKNHQKHSRRTNPHVWVTTTFINQILLGRQTPPKEETDDYSI